MNTPGHTKHCCRLLTILRLTCFIASAASISVNCRSVAAQSPQPNHPQTTAESRKASSNSPGDPQSTDNSVKQILALKDRLLQLSQGEQNETTKAEIAAVMDAIVIAGARAQAMPPIEKKAEQVTQSQLQQMKEQLAERENQMGMLAKQMMEQQRRQPLPPLENGTMKIYKLSYAPARDTAQTVESLFGAQTLRLAVDERSNTLIVYSKPDSITALDALMSRLDEQAAAAAGSEKPQQGALAAPRSLLLRVFWLADGLPQGVGQTPHEFLPDSVLQATTKLGLEAPRLVTQTVNSLALGREEAVDFSTYVPAVLFDQPVGLTSHGRIKLVSDDRVRLEMGVQVSGPATNCELSGSLATPLGHYMVLGTANSLMTEGGAGMGMVGGAAGMAGPGGIEGGGFRPGQPGQPGLGVPGASPAGPGGARGFAGPGAGAPGSGEGAAVPEKPKFDSSRFAFVVQVIEGQSYPAEKDKPMSK
jgi:hypothetical protein